MSEQTPAPKQEGESVRNFRDSGDFAKAVLLLEVERIIVTRLIEHKKNFYMWREGEICGCIRLGVARASCMMCNGTGKADQGALVPTEPDREERDAVRMRLMTAIKEAEAIFVEIFGRPSNEKEKAESRAMG